MSKWLRRRRRRIGCVVENASGIHAPIPKPRHIALAARTSFRAGAYKLNAKGTTEALSPNESADARILLLTWKPSRIVFYQLDWLYIRTVLAGVYLTVHVKVQPHGQGLAVSRPEIIFRYMAL